MQTANYRQQQLVLINAGHSRGVSQSGFGSHIHYVSPLCAQDPASANRRLGAHTHAFPIPGIGRKVDDSHDRRSRVEGEVPVSYRKFFYARLGGRPVALNQLCQIFKI